MIRGKYEVYSGRSHLSADRQGRQTILFPKAIDDYIPARRQACPTALSAEKEGGNQLEFCLQSGQKSYFSHSLTFRAYLKSSEAVRVFSLTQTRYTLIMCRSHLFHTKLTLPVQTIIFVAPLLPFGHIFLSA